MRQCCSKFGLIVQFADWWTDRLTDKNPRVLLLQIVYIIFQTRGGESRREAADTGDTGWCQEATEIFHSNLKYFPMNKLFFVTSLRQIVECSHISTVISLWFLFIITPSLEAEPSIGSLKTHSQQKGQNNVVLFARIEMLVAVVRADISFNKFCYLFKTS